MTRRNFFSATFGALFAGAAAVVGAKVPTAGARFKTIKGVAGRFHGDLYIPEPRQLMPVNNMKFHYPIQEEYFFDYALRQHDGKFLRIDANGHAIATVTYRHSLSGERKQFCLDCYTYGNEIPRRLSVEEADAAMATSFTVDEITMNGEVVWRGGGPVITPREARAVVKEMGKPHE